MAFEDYLNDLCDIYHAQKGDESPGYGLTEQPSFSYPKEPDVLSVACHFAVKSESTSISQTAPANIKESRIKLALPTGTDVSTSRRFHTTSTATTSSSTSWRRAHRGISDGDG